MIIYATVFLLNVVFLITGVVCIAIGFRQYAARGCPMCGYDLRGLRSDRCPECGALRAKVVAEGRFLWKLGLTLTSIPVLLDLALICFRSVGILGA